MAKQRELNPDEKNLVKKVKKTIEKRPPVPTKYDLFESKLAALIKLNGYLVCDYIEGRNEEGCKMLAHIIVHGIGVLIEPWEINLRKKTYKKTI